MSVVATIGVAIVAFSAYTLPLTPIDRRFLILALAMLIGSRITIEIPRAKGHISVSDTFVFLALLLFGGQAAVLLATTEAVASSRRFSKKVSVAIFNAGVMACSTGATAAVVHFGFGSVLNLSQTYSPNLIIALCAMALVQYVLNSGLVAISVALKLDQPLWFTWRTNFLWTSITYFAGASAAAIVAQLINQIGFYAFLALVPIIAIIYLTYRTYLRNVETSAAQAEQARLHVRGIEPIHRRAGSNQQSAPGERRALPHGIRLRGHRHGPRVSFWTLAPCKPIAVRNRGPQRSRIIGI